MVRPRCKKCRNKASWFYKSGEMTGVGKRSRRSREEERGKANKKKEVFLSQNECRTEKQGMNRGLSWVLKEFLDSIYKVKIAKKFSVSGLSNDR